MVAGPVERDGESGARSVDVALHVGPVATSTNTTLQTAQEKNRRFLLV